MSEQNDLHTAQNAYAYEDIHTPLPLASDSATHCVSYAGGAMARSPTATATPSAAQDHLVRDAYDWLYFAATHWSLPDAEDLVQDALLRALETWNTVADLTVEQQRAWLKRVALRSLLTRLRKLDTAERHRDRAQQSTCAAPANQPHEAVAGEAARHARARLRDRLSTQERVLLAVWAEQNAGGMSVNRAATLLGMKPKAYLAARRRLGRTLVRQSAELNLSIGDLTGDDVPLACDGCAAAVHLGGDNHDNG